MGQKAMLCVEITFFLPSRNAVVQIALLKKGEDVCGVVDVLYENYSQLQDTRTLDIHLMPLPMLFPPLFFLAPAMELSGLLTPYIILRTKPSGSNAQMVGNHLWHTGVLFECFFSTRQKRLTMSFNQLALSKLCDPVEQELSENTQQMRLVHFLD